MDPVLYSGMGGAKVTMNKQTLTANNLANASTTGFKADLYSAKSMYMTKPGTNEMVMGQSFVMTLQPKPDLSPGPLMTTGRDLDIAIQGDGWMAVQDRNGGEAYTRAGNLQIDQNGTLTTASGHAVLGAGGPIAIPPSQRVEIAPDGTISVVPLDANPNELAIIEQIRLVSADKNTLMKNEEGLMQLTPGSALNPEGQVRLVNGALEGSNVNAVGEMVRMIEAGREFESHMKLMQSVDDNNKKLAQVLQQ